MRQFTVTYLLFNILCHRTMRIDRPKFKLDWRRQPVAKTRGMKDTSFADHRTINLSNLVLYRT
jgi:hypothetical protein